MTAGKAVGPNQRCDGSRAAQYHHADYELDYDEQQAHHEHDAETLHLQMHMMRWHGAEREPTKPGKCSVRSARTIFLKKPSSTMLKTWIRHTENERCGTRAHG